jgi:transposase
VISAVALRHGLHRNQLYDWRREFRSVAAGEDGLPGSDFVPVVAESPGGCGAAAIEIEIGSAIVRVAAGVELALLGKVLRLLKAKA